MSSPISEIISLTTMAILLCYGGKIVLSGDTLTGDWFIGYLVVFSQIIPPARSLSDGWFKVSKGAASLDRIEDLFEENREAEIENGSEKLASPLESIKLKNIKFSYGDLQVLDDVSFDINKGEVVALVGASGLGRQH